MGCPPVRFRRAAGMLPLPIPQRGGSLEALGPFLNVADRSGFVLAVAWLLAALRPGGPYPLLAVSGEHGSSQDLLLEGSQGAGRSQRGTGPQCATRRTRPVHRRQQRPFARLRQFVRQAAVRSRKCVSRRLYNTRTKASTSAGVMKPTGAISLSQHSVLSGTDRLNSGQPPANWRWIESTRMTTIWLRSRPPSSVCFNATGPQGSR
jgi:hypothetical protein